MLAPATSPNVAALFTQLLRTRGLLARLLGLAIAVSLSISFLAPRTYIARAIFLPEADLSGINFGGALGSLASRLGLAPNLTGTPLEFYATLIGSDEFLARLVRAPLITRDSRGDSTIVTLLDLYSDTDDSLAERITDASQKAWSKTILALDADANTVTIEFKAHDPYLAASVVNQYVALVNEFNVHERQTRAKALRAFLESEALPRAARELSSAEDTLAAFYFRNRSFESSPLLRLEEARLQRRITLKQQSYLELSAQFENARVAEIQDTPVITVVSSGTPPPTASSPKLLVNLLVACLLALTGWFILVLGRLYLDALSTTEPDDVAAARAELLSALRPFRVPLKRLR